MFVDRYGSEDIDDILINGRGVDVNPANKVTRTSVDTPRVEFQVKAGLRYRFRVINGGLMFCPLELSIDEHSLLVIAVDGNPVKPVLFKSIILGAGEISFMFNSAFA